MYTVLGVDGKEYGPVSAEQIRSWIAAGRSNLSTKCKLAGDLEWKTVADFPELSAPPPLVPGAAFPSAIGVAAAGSVAVPQLGVIRCYERSWVLLKANLMPFVLVTLITWIWTGSLLGIQWGLHSRSIGLVGFFLNPLLYGAVVTFFIRKAKGTAAPGMADFFGSFGKSYGTLLGTYFVMGVLIVIGFFVFLLPGVYLAVSYSFAYLLVVDQGKGVWDSMEGSRKMVAGNWWRLFGLLLLGIPFMLLGVACLVVGLLVTTPLVVGAIYYAYLDLSGQSPPELPKA